VRSIIDGKLVRRRELDARGRTMPPAPPGVRYVPVPVAQVIVIADDELRSRVHGLFHWPMIVLALLVLPLLAVGHFFAPARWSLLWWLSTFGLIVIWFAFLVEFVIKVAIAESRFEYARHNWIDIVIILLPALRPLRIASIARTGRMLRLRGVGMKALRYVVAFVLGLQATEQILGRFGVKKPGERSDPRRMTRAQLVKELTALRTTVDRWSAWHDAHVQWLEDHGLRPPIAEPPSVEAEMEAIGDEFDDLDRLPVEPEDEGEIDPEPTERRRAAEPGARPPRARL